MNDISKIIQDRFLLQEEYLGKDKPVNRIIPLVSITVITYQHKLYIRQCLDGILMQKVNFSYEIIIGEDGSVDGTREICEEYAIRYPDRIRLFNRNRNLSQYKTDEGKIIRFNGIWNRMSCRGQYIAFCEGDDYWTDPLKLQKQVDILLQDSNIGLCYTKIVEYIQESKKFGNLWGGVNVKFNDLLNLNTIPTLTCLIRRDLYLKYVDEIKPQERNWKMGDYPMWLWFSYNSNVFFLNEISGVYRVLKNSVSHSTDILKKIEFILSTIDIKLYFILKYSPDMYSHYQNEHMWWQLVYSIINHNNDDIIYLANRLKCSKKLISKRKLIVLSSCRFPKITYILTKCYIKYFIR